MCLWEIEQKHESGSDIWLIADRFVESFSLFTWLASRKLFSNSFDIIPSRFPLKHLKYRRHRTKRYLIGNVISGYPQGSIFWPLLFKIKLRDFFFYIKQFWYGQLCIQKCALRRARKRQVCYCITIKVSVVMFKWFRDNQMQGNADTCHVLKSTEQCKYKKYTISWNSCIINGK